jgi:hypothetical protein
MDNNFFYHTAHDFYYLVIFNVSSLSNNNIIVVNYIAGIGYDNPWPKKDLWTSDSLETTLFINAESKSINVVK